MITVIETKKMSEYEEEALARLAITTAEQNTEWVLLRNNACIVHHQFKFPGDTPYHVCFHVTNNPDYWWRVYERCEQLGEVYRAKFKQFGLTLATR